MTERERIIEAMARALAAGKVLSSFAPGSEQEYRLMARSALDAALPLVLPERPRDEEAVLDDSLAAVRTLHANPDDAAPADWTLEGARAAFTARRKELSA